MPWKTSDRPPGSAAALSDVVPAIRAHAAERPDGQAVKDRHMSLTYAGFFKRITAMAHWLIQHGVEPGERVGIHLENSAEYVVAILACLTVGAVFVPIPYSDPEERICRIAHDCGVTLTLAPGGRAYSAEAERALRPISSAEAVTNTGLIREPPNGPDALLYLVYTSGTTGDPKGVMIRRKSLRNFVRNTIDTFGLDTGTRALCVSPFHFDGAFGSLFSVLVAGGSLVVADPGLLPGEFFQLLLAEEITHTSFSPSLLRLLTSSRDLPRLAGSRLRTIGLGGEDCAPDPISALYRHRSQLRVFNRYGPTETTVVVASYLVTPEWCASGRKIPLGSPDPGVSFYIVDAQGRLVTDLNTAGELCVGGVQLMAGYWGAPELTAAVLRDDLVPGHTVYRTGDLVERTEDGSYVYLGRADNIVKRSGNRISMTEITAALLTIPGITDAATVADRPSGRTVIRAYVVASRPLSPAAIRTELLLRIPGYMNPDSLELISDLPRLSNGKPNLQRLQRASPGHIAGVPGIEVR